MTSMYSGGGNVIQEERRDWWVDESKPPFKS
jgi:hypothetical protein